MKNKLRRKNSMKLKKAIAASLAISMLFAFTGCGNSSDSATAENTEQESASATDAGGTSASAEKLDDLYQQENRIFADHKNVWDKVFGFMSKNVNDDTMNENYADFLANTIESNKDSFSEEEYATLSKDIETIRGIEEEITKLEKEIAASDSSSGSSSSSADSAGVFHGFKGKDLDGNDVDESLFAQNKVTVVNFWFSGCKPCVEELSKLNELNDEIRDMGGEVVGINTDTLDNNQDGIKEAKEILKAQGASYKNLTFDSDSTVGKYAGNIMAFPTTVLVDKDGNIIGEPFMGGINDQSNYEQLMKQIQSILDQNHDYSIFIAKFLKNIVIMRIKQHRLTLETLNRNIIELQENESGKLFLFSEHHYRTIYGYHYRSDGTTKTDLYAYMQNPKFELAINSLYSKEKYDIYVTGSNAFLLSADLATLFTGRYIEIHVFPFSFQEYCQYYDDVSDKDNLFDEYAIKGGLAGSYAYRTEKDRTNYIKEVYETIVTRDLVQKYALPDTLVLQRLSEFLMDNISNLTSPNKVSQLLTANETPTNHVTVGKYIKYLCNAFVFYDRTDLEISEPGSGTPR